MFTRRFCLCKQSINIFRPTVCLLFAARSRKMTCWKYYTIFCCDRQKIIEEYIPNIRKWPSVRRWIRNCELFRFSRRETRKKTVHQTLGQLWSVINLKNSREREKNLEKKLLNWKRVNKIDAKIRRRNRKMLPETQCNEALVVKGATDFSIAAIMGRQTVCIDSPEKSSSKSRCRVLHLILLVTSPTHFRCVQIRKYRRIKSTVTKQKVEAKKMVNIWNHRRRQVVFAAQAAAEVGFCTFVRTDISLPVFEGITPRE